MVDENLLSIESVFFLSSLYVYRHATVGSQETLELLMKLYGFKGWAHSAYSAA